jgi:hypothetical protein
MPSRTLGLAIIVFWLGTTAWFFWRELLPAWRPGQPPPYTIDLADEANHQNIDIMWTVYLEEDAATVKVGQARTSVKFHEAEDTFELHMAIVGGSRPPVPGEEQPPVSRFQIGRFQVKKMESTYLVTRAGELLEATNTLVADAEVIGILVRDLKMVLKGKVQGQRFQSTCQFIFPVPFDQLAGDLGKEKKLPPVDVSQYGSMLQPLHPLNRIRGLRPGQTWRMPLFDPFAGALARLGGEAQPRFLTAHVQGSTQPLPGHPDVQCLVIEYDGDESQPRTWVQASTDLVLRQEANVMGKRLILQRDTIR